MGHGAEGKRVLAEHELAERKQKAKRQSEAGEALGEVLGQLYLCPRRSSPERPPPEFSTTP